MTMMTSSTSAMNQLTFDLSAVAENPAALSAAPNFAASQPSTAGLLPIFTETGEPAGPSTDLKDRPDLVRKSLVRSQSENFDHGPTKMWKLQVPLSAVTVIGFAFENASRSGFT